MQNMKELQEQAKAIWGERDYRSFFSPGRVNLIGEHTDYNGGYVFPCALSCGTALVAAFNGSDYINFASTNLSSRVSVHIKDIGVPISPRVWANYPMGVLWEFAKKGVELKGMDILISGNIPNGAGLSSSASLELVTAVMCNSLFEVGLDNMTMAWMGKAAENNFVGLNCGILDQFAVAMGKENHAMALKCDTMDWEYVPLKLGDYRLVISNTNKRRSLASSKYNQRVAECARAVELISQVKAIEHLGDLNMADFVEVQAVIKDETILRRARHIVSENQRVLDGIPALKAGDLKLFGEYMNASHDSLREDYEVTGMELDTLVEEARKLDGVLGSRMTGAGFGGCTVSLVHQDVIDEFQDRVGMAYTARTGLIPIFYLAEIGGGAREV